MVINRSNAGHFLSAAERWANSGIITWTALRNHNPSTAGAPPGGKVLCWIPPSPAPSRSPTPFSVYTSLISTYDVDYETFGRRSTDLDSFAFCIEELISQLKKAQLISVATIAAFHSTVAHYMALFRNYGVNY